MEMSCRWTEQGEAGICKICLSVLAFTAYTTGWMAMPFTETCTWEGKQGFGGGWEGWKGTVSLSLDLLRWNAVGTSKRRGQVGGHRHHAPGEERSRPGKEIWGWSAIRRIFEARNMMGHSLRRQEG